MNNLPVEVLYRIFALFREQDDQESLSTCTLVCKCWNQPSQHLLYSKSVMKKEGDLRHFYESIKNNAKLANMVKELKLFGNPHIIYVGDETAFINLFDYLPSLEVLRKNCAISSYIPILDAVLGSKLPCLRTIEALPLREEDYNDYATCMLLMKDQVESLIVADRNTVYYVDNRAFYGADAGHGGAQRTNATIASFKTKERFNRLYTKLHQFPKLEEILVITDTDDPISVLDSTTERCLGLHTVRYDFVISNDKSQKTYDSSKILEFAPRPNIKTLHGIEINLCKSQLYLYIMHKYPQLQNLCLENKAYRNSIPLWKEIVSPFFAYLTKINKVSLYELYIKLDDFINVIQSFWKHPANRVAKHVRIQYEYVVGNKVKLDILKGNTFESRDRTNITFQREEGETVNRTTKFIEEIGDQFEDLHLIGCINDYLSISTPTNLNVVKKICFDYILCRCPNLQNLHLYQCNLKKIEFWQSHLSYRKRNFQALSIEECEVNCAIFEKLSRVFESLGHLKLKDNILSSLEGASENFISIDMIDTEIDTLTIEYRLRLQYRRVYLKIFTPALEEYRYYKYELLNSNDGILKFCEKGRPNKDKKITLFNIRCQSLSCLQMSYGGRLASITFQ